MTKYQSVHKQFQQALVRLEEVLRQEKNDYIRDSAIKRFEIVFDLSWKAIKAHLEERGVTCASPLGCFKEAYRQGLVDYEENWVNLVKMRNLTVHVYDEEKAEKVYAQLPQAVKSFQALAQRLVAQRKT